MGLLIDMIDVGQGDSFLLTIDGPYGEAYVLVDAGLPDAGVKVLNYIKTRKGQNGGTFVNVENPKKVPQ
jgi:hypothetical protein